MLFSFITPNGNFITQNTDYKFYFRERGGSSQIDPKGQKVDVSSEKALDEIEQGLQAKGYVRKSPSELSQSELSAYLQMNLPI